MVFRGVVGVDIYIDPLELAPQPVVINAQALIHSQRQQIRQRQPRSQDIRRNHDGLPRS
jgi:hypothetical protein